MDTKRHWEAVFTRGGGTSSSWYQPHLNTSLQYIHKTGLPTTARIMDAGGGDSTLVDDLIELGFEDLTVLDMSAEALSNARRRLGEASEKVHWIEADIEHVKLPADPYDLWHDRALFHFLTTPEARSAYLEILEGALKPGGYAIFATFADDGPEQCSGLPTERYSTEKLLMVLGSGFDLIESERQVHLTPGGSEQRFLYSLFRKQPSFNIAGNP